MILKRLESYFYNWSIQIKLVFIISVIIIVSISSIIYLATYFFKQDNEIRIKENTLEVTQLIASKTKSDITNIIRESTVLANQALDNKITGIPKKFLKESIQSLYEGEEIVAIYIYSNSKKPTLINSIYNNFILTENRWNRTRLESLVTKNLKSYSQSLKGELVVRNSSIESIPLLGLSHPFRQGEAGFYVTISKMDGIQSSLNNSGITDNLILTGDGTILAHSKADIVPKQQSLKDSGLFDKIRKSAINNGQLKYAKESDEYYISSFRKLGIADLTVVTEVSEDKAMEEVNNIQRRNFFLLIIILNLSIFVVLLFSKRLTNPILKLVEASHRIEKGDFHINMKEESGDEIGVLTRSFTSMAKGLSERDRIKDAFGKFVNTDLAEQVLHGELKLGGSRKECTIFFSDIRDFTSNSEIMEPEDVVEFLNDYMSVMVACVNRHNGVVDKFIGDSIMAVWGAINSSKNDPTDAVLCALDMRDALTKFNSKKRINEYPFIRIGIGINTGPVISGQIGSEERLEFTVVGDAVNLASRIESLNKEFKTDILVSESTYEKTKDLFQYEKMKSIQVKGKTKAQTIYALLGKKGDKSTLNKAMDINKPPKNTIKSVISKLSSPNKNSKRKRA